MTILPKQAEVEFLARGLRPSHRVGYLQELRAAGLEVQIAAGPGSLGRFFWAHPWAWVIRCNVRLALTWRPAAVISEQEPASVLLLLLRRLGLFRAHIVQLTVAVLDPKNCSGWRRHFWRLVLPGADAVVYFAPGQGALLADVFGLPSDRLHYVPLGVDNAFYDLPGDQARSPRLVVSLGINPGRDFITPTRALSAIDGITAELITDRDNLQGIRSQVAKLPAGWRLRESGVSPLEIVELYRRAAVGIVATHDVDFSIGQTVLLELMSSGCPLVVTNTPPLRGYVVDRETALLVPPEDAAAMTSAVQELLEDRALAARLGSNAARVARDQFSAQRMADKLASLVLAPR